MVLRRPIFSGAAAVFLVVTAVYWPTLRGGFVYDSIAQVLYSDYIHTPSHWADVLTLRVVGQDELDRNRPLHLASLMLDAAMWGKNPFGYRLTSVLLHALNASLLFAFIAMTLRRRTTGGGDAAATFAVVSIVAAFGAIVFALHPLVVEAVAEPSNREDLLVLLPMLTGLLCLAAPVRSMFVANSAFVICSFLAVLAKESGIAVPFVFVAGCWLFYPADSRRFAPGLIGGFTAAVAFLIASYVSRPGESAIFANAPQPLADNFWIILEVQLRIWTLQFWQIIWPWNLSAHYTAEAIGGIGLPVAITVVAAVVVAGYFAGRRDRLAALGAAVYVLCLLPASNFAAQYHPIADRYLYVPLAGIGMIVAAVANRLRIQNSRRFAGRTLFITVSVLLAFEYAANVRRQFIWQQPETLWSDVLRQYPDLAQAHLGMANACWRAGDFGAALASADDAVNNSSGLWADPFACRAMCEWQTGNRERAMEDFRQARRLSRVYRSEESMAEAMIFSPEQLRVLAEMLRAR